jgi:hypothetical protein
MRIYKAVLWAFLLATLLLQTGGQVALAADITFDSFEAAEAAAKKRAEEYQKKMQEHIKSVNEQWEKQQKDLGADSSSPDISKITTRQDGQKSSDTDASKSLEGAVNSSINRLKDEMVSKAGPTSTGFAGGAAGYQWSVKFKNGKYVLSDSYNEAEFNTGKKKETEAPAPTPVQTEPEEVASGEDNDSDAGSAAEPSPEPTTTAATSESTPASTDPAATTTTPADSKPATAPTTTATKPAAPEEPTKPLTGVDPAPVKLPPPSIRMVIQHPTDFSEEVFASNANSETTANYRLDKFKIPEDTRIKIAVEVGEDVDPADVSMVVTDDQGDNTPVSAAKLKNYRHMFRVPSDDQYSASVYVNNRKTPGGQQKKILQVAIPVSKVDFESRTIDNQRGSKSGSGASNMSSSDTSSSGGNANVNHSSFGKPQAVDLSDLYVDPARAASAADTGSSVSEGDSSASAATSGSEAASTGSDGSGGQSYSGNSAASASGGSGEGAADDSASGSSADGMADGIANDETSAQSTDDAQTAAATEETSNSAGAGSYSDQQQANSGARYSDTGSGDDQGQGSEDSSSAPAGSGDAATDEATSETSGNSAGDETAAGASGNNQDEKLKNQGSAGSKSAKTGKEQNNTEEDPFLLAISLRAEAQKVYQSFDFIDGNTQTSSTIKAGGEVVFSLNMGTDVNPESIQIKLSDGSQEIKGNLKRMGESFAYVFKSPTESAFIEVSGKTSKRSFTYKVGIPVK